MTFQDIHVLVAIKLIFLIFLIFGFFSIRKKFPLWIFLLCFGLASAGAYALLVNDTALLFFGLEGDEVTIAAMYNTFAHVGFTSDFAFHGLPAFYPPLYFWIFAIPGKWFAWNGVQIAKVASATFFLCFPIGLYLLQRMFATKEQRTSPILLTFAFLAPLFIMSTLGIDLLIGKPYEIIAASVTICWTIALYTRAKTRRLSWKEIFAFGIVSGLLFMMYYLWLLFAGIVFIIQIFLLERQYILPYIRTLASVAVVGIITALPFLAPLIHAYTVYGLESWQTSFYVPASSNLWLPLPESCTLISILLFAGFVSLLWYHKETIPKILLSFLGTAYIWWGFGLSLLFFFSTPFQEFRGFYVLSPMILSLGAAYGASKLWLFLKHSHHDHARITLAIVGLLFLSGNAVFGFFVDDPAVQAYSLQSKKLTPPIAELVEFAKTIPDFSSHTTLHTLPELPAFVPVQHYLYFNQHNTHPAAIFSERYNIVQSIAAANTSEELYTIVTSAPYGPIDQFIFYKQEDKYYLFYHLDKPIVGIEEVAISFTPDLFSDTYFNTLYESEKYVIIRRKNDVVAL